MFCKGYSVQQNRTFYSLGYAVEMAEESLPRKLYWERERRTGRIHRHLDWGNSLFFVEKTGQCVELTHAIS